MYDVAEKVSLNEGLLQTIGSKVEMVCFKYTVFNGENHH